jgi:hypothetical protein
VIGNGLESHSSLMLRFSFVFDYFTKISDKSLWDMAPDGVWMNILAWFGFKNAILICAFIYSFPG